MLHTHVRTLSQAERESEMGDNLEEEGKLTVHMWFFFLVCVRTVRVRVRVCVDLRSVLRLSVKSRSERLCPGLEEERGGLSPSSVVSSEKRTKETTTLPMMLFKKKMVYAGWGTKKRKNLQRFIRYQIMCYHIRVYLKIFLLVHAQLILVKPRPYCSVYLSSK